MSAAVQLSWPERPPIPKGFVPVPGVGNAFMVDQERGNVYRNGRYFRSADDSLHFKPGAMLIKGEVVKGTRYGRSYHGERIVRISLGNTAPMPSGKFWEAQDRHWDGGSRAWMYTIRVADLVWYACRGEIPEGRRVGLIGGTPLDTWNDNLCLVGDAVVPASSDLNPAFPEGDPVRKRIEEVRARLAAAVASAPQPAGAGESLLLTNDAARLAGISAEGLRGWVSKGWLKPARTGAGRGRNGGGRPANLFRVEDVRSAMARAAAARAKQPAPLRNPVREPLKISEVLDVSNAVDLLPKVVRSAVSLAILQGETDADEIGRRAGAAVKEFLARRLPAWGTSDGER